MNNTTENTFLELTANEFQVDRKDLSLETEFREMQNWSSLNALVYVAAINDNYGVLISSTTLSKSINLGDLFNQIYKS